MYKINDPIQFEEKVGRVYSYGNNGSVNVLVRVNENTWKLENWYTLMCRPYVGYLWTYQNVFGNKMKLKNYTPELTPMDVDDDPHVIHLN